MNELKKLSYDARVYKDLIKDYTSDPYITQTIDNLIKCIDKNDLQGVILFLERLKNWYDVNMIRIRANDYVLNLDSHILAFNQIREYYSSISEIEVQDEKNKKVDYASVSESQSEKSTNGYKIFISHSSKDEPICTAFVHLLEVLGVPETNILYSSSERFGIPADMNIFDYLRSSIVENFIVYYMLSDNYYESVYCLNEMGAVWVNQNDFSIYLLPNMSKSIVGVIDSNKKGYRLDNAINLNQLREKISRDFNNNISNNKWDEEKEKFLKIVYEFA